MTFAAIISAFALFISKLLHLHFRYDCLIIGLHFSSLLLTTYDWHTFFKKKRLCSLDRRLLVSLELLQPQKPDVRHLLLELQYREAIAATRALHPTTVQPQEAMQQKLRPLSMVLLPSSRHQHTIIHQ